MKRNYYTLLRAFALSLTGLFGLAACDSTHLEETTPASPYSVSLAQIQVAARHEVTGQPAGAASGKEVESITAVPDKGEPDYYVINYRGGGFRLLAGDRRVEPLLAYSETGIFRTAGPHPDALEDWLKETEQNLHKLKQRSDLTIPATVATQWKVFLTNKLSDQTDQPRPPADECNGGSTQTFGPLLTTQWGQGCGYNDFVPTGSYSCGHMPTGCVATAVAQVMYFHRAPATAFDWANMAANTPTSSTATLMANIGSAVGMNYNDTGSSATSGAALNALRYTYGYQSGNLAAYNRGTLRNSLYLRRPVILLGDNGAVGHAWVCDGLQDTSIIDCETGSGASFSMYHMNWGWNEMWSSNNYNGYYSENNWTVTRSDGTFSFNNNKGMIYDIRP
jgi:hypothetical protein